MKNLFSLLIALLVISSTLVTHAQTSLQMPQPSTAQTIIQEFGLGKVTLNYSRPNVKGRKIFGSLQPYGQVWRTGANNATVITFTDEVSIEGNKVPAGEYALFTIPDAREWTIILNKTTKQWGAYEYKQADDFLRFKVKADKMTVPVETFTMQLANVKPTTANLTLMWERTSLTLHLTTEIDNRIMSGIEEAMKSAEKKPYFAAAQYYYENNKDLNKALEWMTEIEKTAPKATYYKYWKARIQLKKGDKAAAIATAQEGARLAKAEKNDEYVRLNEGVIAQAK
ncbi:DUF2911 domain-containing protein [Mucilaginibacter terrae]|uniref:DUF2911 domain-containing protein n=1 Tax=Mucilaginibacter terrae TaxID=1955052 RepID=UPI003634AF46